MNILNKIMEEDTIEEKVLTDVDIDFINADYTLLQIKKFIDKHLKLIKPDNSKYAEGVQDTMNEIKKLILNNI